VGKSLHCMVVLPVCKTEMTALTFLMKQNVKNKKCCTSLIRILLARMERLI